MMTEEEFKTLKRGSVVRWNSKVCNILGLVVSVDVTTKGVPCIDILWESYAPTPAGVNGPYLLDKINMYQYIEIFKVES